jgi:hypothetical protein
MKKAKVTWTPCTPDQAHMIASLSSYRQTNVKNGRKTTWYNYKSRVAESYRIWSEEAWAYVEAGYNAEYYDSPMGREILARAGL